MPVIFLPFYLSFRCNPGCLPMVLKSDDNMQTIAQKKKPREGQIWFQSVNKRKFIVLWVAKDGQVSGRYEGHKVAIARFSQKWFVDHFERKL